MVIWITGLSGAGKTTLSNNLAQHFRSQGKTILQLDGDEMRKVLNLQSSFDSAQRFKVSQIYSRMTKYAADQGIIVIVSVIGLFKETFDWNRKNIPDYCEIFLDTPIEEIIRRNSKNIYSNTQNSHPVAGIDFEVDFPTTPDIHIQYSVQKSPNDVAKDCLKILYEKFKAKLC